LICGALTLLVAGRGRYGNTVDKSFSLWHEIYFGNSLDKLRHTRSDAYSVKLVLLNKHQISGGGVYPDSYFILLIYLFKTRQQFWKTVAAARRVQYDLNMLLMHFSYHVHRIAKSPVTSLFYSFTVVSEW